MSILAEIFAKYGTDKGSYASSYEFFLAAERHSVRRVLEVGIGTLTPGAHSNMIAFAAAHYRPGGSLRSWRDYFPTASIVGFDVQPDTQFTEDRIRTFLCDSTDRESVDQIMEREELGDFDLIIDDGSHLAENQLKTLKNLYGYLRPGGIFVIEDVTFDELLGRSQDVINYVSPSVLFYAKENFNPIFIKKAGEPATELQSR